MLQQSLMSNINFKLMAAEFKVRDFVRPREEILAEANLKKGFHVLDYGCGPGGYIVAASVAVGPEGKVYALDVNPIALGMVEKKIAKNSLKNVQTIQSEWDTGLKDKTLDVALLYDVFHDLEENQNPVLNEIYRVLKPDGILSFSDHHLSEDEIISKVTATGLFTIQQKGKYTYTFRKVTPFHSTF